VALGCEKPQNSKILELFFAVSKISALSDFKPNVTKSNKKDE